jgi:WD40 repeat protein
LELAGHRGAITSLEFSGDSRRFVTASHDRTARIWSVDPPGLLRVMDHAASLSSASFDPSGRLVVTGSADNTISVWNAEMGNKLATLRWHGEGVNDVHFEPDGKGILSASDDGTVKLGQCEACSLTLDELRLQVPVLAKLTDDDAKVIRGETATRYWRLPAFLQRKR